MSSNYSYSLIFFADGGVDALNTATYATDGSFMPGCKTTFAFVGEFREGAGALTLTPTSGSNGVSSCLNAGDNKEAGPIGSAQLSAQTYDFRIDGNTLKLTDRTSRSVTTFTRK